MRAARSMAAALVGAVAVAATPAAADLIELIPNGRTDAGWATSTETGAGFITFVPAGTSVTPVLRFPIVPHGNPFWIFEQIGPDVQRLSTPLAPLPPGVPPGSVLPALFSFDVAVDNYAHILQGLAVVLIQESPAAAAGTGIPLVFKGDPPGTQKPHAPMRVEASFSLSAGPSKLVVTLPADQFFVDATASGFSVLVDVVPEPSSLALTSTVVVLLAAILAQRRLQHGAAQRSDPTKQT
jgi:hypothetical protein